MNRSIRITIVVMGLLLMNNSWSQTNLLLNGGFEDVNTCTEYKAECGVEAWFYLRDVKAQMLLNETNIGLVGANSFGIYYNWQGYTGFTPIIGTLLPCNLQKDQRYIFKGIISASLHVKLLLQPGICLGEKFYVPNRHFAKDMRPDSILSLKAIPETKFFRFEYHFIATGQERYLTFGTFVKEDTTGAKKKLYGTQTVSLVLDNFELVPENNNETFCPAFSLFKESIYEYNFRHKEMDYSLYGKGELEIDIGITNPDRTTKIKQPPPPPRPLRPDTLKLGDVFFDFNKADLKPAALNMLSKYFTGNSKNIDSIYIEGHTDSVGSDKRNIELSLQRCEAVTNWLSLNSIITPHNFFIHPFGRSRPVASNKTPAGRAMNRRVEIIVFRKNREP